MLKGRIFFKFFLVLLVLIPIMYLIANSLVNKQVENTKDELRKDNIPTGPDELIRSLPVLTKAENAADDYLLAYSKLDKISGLGLDKEGLNERLTSSLHLNYRNDPIKKYDANKTTEQNILDEELPFFSYQGEAAKKLDEFMDGKKLQEIYQAVKKGASKKLTLYKRDYHKGFELLLPLLNKQRFLIRLLMSYHDSLFRRKQFEKSLEVLHTALLFCKHHSQEPTLISNLVNIACRNITYNRIYHFVSSSTDPQNLESATLIEITKILKKAQAHDDEYIEAMKGECSMGIDGIEKLIEGKIDMSSITGDSAFEYYRIFLIPLLKKELIFCMKFYQRVITHIDKKSAQEIQALDLYSLKDAPNPSFIAKMLLPALSSAYLKTCLMKTTCNLLLTGIAIKKYQLNHKALPTSLAELPQEVQDLKDWMNGKPFKYIKTAEGYTLYSVGKNLLDDHGNNKRDLDLIWKFN